MNLSLPAVTGSTRADLLRGRWLGIVPIPMYIGIPRDTWNRYPVADLVRRGPPSNPPSSQQEVSEALAGWETSLKFG